MSHDNYNGSGPDRSTATPQMGEWDLFNQPVPEPRAELTDPDWQNLTPAERFERFHAENPQVYREIVKRCRQWRDVTPGKLGMSLLFGIVRWELALQTKGDPYRINDHYAAYYARLVMWMEDGMEGLFEIRRSADADAWIDDLKRRTA